MAEAWPTRTRSVEVVDVADLSRDSFQRRHEMTCTPLIVRGFIPEAVRAPLAAEIKRVSRKGVVIHGPAGDAAIELSQRFIAALSARGVRVPRYAYEHLEFSMPMPAWFAQTFPGCRLTPRRNFDVELATIMTEFTPLARWLSGYRHRRLATGDDRPPFVEYTMTWRKVS